MPKNLNDTKNIFNQVSCFEGNPKWDTAICRENPLSSKNFDVRTDFGRDYTRILHSLGYRRLKNKTQVFYSPENDHICTRIEHVNHVESVSFTIANHLGMNTELTKAISTGHDIGHAPFGHLGEQVINKIAKQELGTNFWHEQNGLKFVDKIELLRDSDGNFSNLNLTYATRDGIISHCGEVNQNGLKPRNEAIDLCDYNYANQYAPFTWEGCIVKLSDKISYLGRDIDDALHLNIISNEDVAQLNKLANETFGSNISKINTTNLINKFVTDVCINSNPDDGILLSDEAYALMKEIMKFNYKSIYRHPKLDYYNNYAEDIIYRIFEVLSSGYDGMNTKNKLLQLRNSYPDIIDNFLGWIDKYWNIYEGENRNPAYKHHLVYDMEKGENEYKTAIIDYISGMTDSYAKMVHSSICSFR